jgi:transcriptional regulator with XRE-family HTH domain
MGYDFKGLKLALARNVRGLRRRHGLSQEELADGASLDRTYISQIERGVGNPSLRVIAQIAVALQVKPGELLDGHFS